MSECKRWLMTFGLLGCMWSTVVAQPGGAPAKPQPGVDRQLDDLLAKWEEDLGRNQSLVMEFTVKRTYPNQGNITKEFAGFLRCMRLPDGNYGAVMEQRRKDNPNHVTEKYVCTGTHVYNIVPDEKKIYVHALPARQQGQALDEGALPFLFGMRADTARRRYQLKSYESPDPARQLWYLYVDVVPNYARDLQDFHRARLTIMKQDSKTIPKGMPFQVHWVEPGNNQTTWDVERVQRNVPNLVQAKEFAKPQVPPGYEVVNVPIPGAPGGRPPDVIRRQQP